jgi:hypothetical protein
MSVVRLRAYAASAVPAPAPDEISLFKEDYPRRIDRFIRFFGEQAEPVDDVCGEALLEQLGSVAGPAR